MAKNFKAKQVKAKVVKFDAINGESSDGTHWELEYSKDSKRYNLRTYNHQSGADHGENLVYSHISLDACKRKAADKEVVWR
mgnify:FL=1|jgi:hypothetical protein